MNINEIWEAIESGKTVNWQHKLYEVYAEPAAKLGMTGYEFQRDHFSNKNDQILVVRHLESFHQSIIAKSELKNCYKA